MTRVNSNWQPLALPLKAITLKRQGTKHSPLDDLLSQLQHSADRVNAGNTLGYDHDDDFGYVSKWSTKRMLHFLLIRQVSNSFFLGRTK